MTLSFAFQASTQRILSQNRIGPYRFETTLGHGFRNVRFRAPDPPDPSGRSAEDLCGFTKKHNIRSYAQNLQIPVGVVLDELSKLFNVFSYVIL